MNDNPDEINDADRYIEQTLWKEGQAYADHNRESKERNKARAESREKVKKIGVNTNAYATAVAHIKNMSSREREEWLRDYNLTMKVLGARQAELFPDEALKIAKRESDRKAREAEARTKAGPDADTNHRSDPKRGGAGKAKAKPAPTTLKEATAQSDAAIKESLAAVQAEKPALRIVGSEPGEMKQPDVPPNPPGEQEEGAAALAVGLAETNAKKSQSQIAAEKLEAAKLN